MFTLAIGPLVKCISRDIANGRKQASIRFLGCVGYGLVILELLKVKDEKEEKILEAKIIVALCEGLASSKSYWIHRYYINL